MAERQSLQATAEQIEALLGKDEAGYVAYHLGPPDGTFASAEPLGMRLASFVRGHFAVLVRDLDCECVESWGCDLYSSFCSQEKSCNSGSTWPMCGYWWNTICDGLCAEDGAVKLRKTRSSHPQGIAILSGLEHDILRMDLGCLPAA